MKTPQKPPDLRGVLKEIHGKPLGFFLAVTSPGYSVTVKGRYVHWNKLRHLTPPAGLSREQWWAYVKLARRGILRPLPIKDGDGEDFWLSVPDPMLQQLSELDRDMGGRVSVPEVLNNADARDRYLQSTLIEEAITSSQLEGAATTRRVAAEMLRTGRAPRNHDERMIVNNFDAMRFVSTLASNPLTPDTVLEIHRRVTEGTLDNARDAGRLRTSDDVKVMTPEGDVLHTPPMASELPRRMQVLCDLANALTPSTFVHPIVRAVLLHFTLAYAHPFVDGNGRTARSLFYWAMLRSKYDLTAFLSISSILRKAPSKYARAYLYTETDENDTTYFVLYQLDVLQRALRALHDYVRSKAESHRRTQALLKESSQYNYRQLALLDHALRNPTAQYSVTGHANSHRVTRQTARTDLTALLRSGFLTTVKFRNGLLYEPVPNVDALVKNSRPNPKVR